MLSATAAAAATTAAATATATATATPAAIGPEGDDSKKGGNQDEQSDFTGRARGDGARGSGAGDGGISSRATWMC